MSATTRARSRLLIPDGCSHNTLAAWSQVKFPFWFCSTWKYKQSCNEKESACSSSPSCAVSCFLMLPLAVLQTKAFSILEIPWPTRQLAPYNCLHLFLMVCLIIHTPPPLPSHYFPSTSFAVHTWLFFDIPVLPLSLLPQAMSYLTLSFWSVSVIVVFYCFITARHR